MKDSYKCWKERLEEQSKIWWRNGMMDLVRRSDLDDITIRQQNEKNDREHMKSHNERDPGPVLWFVT